MKILVANPNSSENVTNSIMKSLSKVPLHEDTEIIPLTNPKGTHSIDSTFSDYQSSWSYQRAVLETVKEQDIDAVVVGGFGNLGVYGLKEALDIPVLGMSETSMALGSTLGHKFSVLTTLNSFVPAMEDLIKVYEMGPKCASVRAIDMNVQDSVNDREKTLRLLEEEIRDMLLKDGCEVVILGSGGLSGYNETLQERIGIPILDPGQVTLKMAEMMVEMNISHSKRRKFAFPPQNIEEYFV